MTNQERYCLDANVLISAWQQDYPPDLFPNPWKLLIDHKSKINQCTIVTLESIQIQEPSKVSNYKMPLICKKEEVSCIDFVTLLRKLNRVV